MKLIKEVEIIEDKQLIKRLNIAGIVLMIGMVIPFFILGLKIAPDFSTAINLNDFIDNDWLVLIINLIILFAIVLIHELIHGLFFKVFKPEGKVKFGFKAGMAYAASPGNFYTKFEMFVIAFAPFFFITLGLTLLMYFLNIDIISFVVLAAIHAGGCVGDLYYVYLLIRAPKGAQVEDTEQGIRIYVN